MFLKRSVERPYSCITTIADCDDRFISFAEQYDLTTNEGLARCPINATVLQCGSYFDEPERYYCCTGDDDLGE